MVFRCVWCRMPQDDFTDAERAEHRQQCHNGQAHPVDYIQGLQCTQCGFTPKAEETILRHVCKAHDVPYPHPCKEAGCTRKFLLRHRLRDHLMQCHAGDTRGFACTISGCSHKFATPTALRLHMRTVHMAKSSGWVCSYGCHEGKPYATATVFATHMMMHRADATKPSCADCGRRFNSKQALRAHKWSQHTPKETWPSACRHCSKRFWQTTQHRKHESSCKGAKTKVAEPPRKRQRTALVPYSDSDDSDSDSDDSAPRSVALMM